MLNVIGFKKNVIKEQMKIKSLNLARWKSLYSCKFQGKRGLNGRLGLVKNKFKLTQV